MKFCAALLLCFLFAFPVFAQTELLVCGDAQLTPDEECDDGNKNPGDGCSPDCMIEKICGDGKRQGNEVCDDGNTNSGDGCRADCNKVEICGDSALDPQEQCDDGNKQNNDGCNSSCQKEICGDKVVQHNETCDDGNNTPNDGCSGTCTSEITNQTPALTPNQKEGDRLFNYWKNRYYQPPSYNPISKKSSGTALSLSIGSTFGPAVLGRVIALSSFTNAIDGDVLIFVALGLRAAGFIVGPSVGQFYLGNHRMGLGTVGLRFLSLAGVATGSFLTFIGAAETPALAVPGVALTLGSIGMYFYYAVNDFIWVGRFAKKHNDFLDYKAKFVLLPTQNKGMTAGLQFTF